MRNSILISFLFFPLIINANAQKKQRFGFYSSGGISFSSYPKEFHDYWDYGSYINIGLEYQFKSFISLIGHFGYGNFKFNGDEFVKKSDPGLGDSLLSVRGGEIYTLAFISEIKMGLPLYRYIYPYFSAGTGFIMLGTKDIWVTYRLPIGDTLRTFTEENISKGNKKYGLSVLAGIGVEFYIWRRLNLLIEGKYIAGYIPFWESKRIHYIPVTFGIKFKL